MMIHTISIEYQEPFTGIFVNGRNEYIFRNEKEIEDTLFRWRKALTERYGDTVRVVDLTASFNFNLTPRKKYLDN